jgi:hypothetical protein
MRTIALRYSENFAPDAGTISAHRDIIESNGYVWYGKLGAKISTEAKNSILTEDSPKILLIHSGKIDRYWAYVKEILFECPEDIENIPSYYRDNRIKFKTWFKVTRFEKASNDVLSKCIVASSKQPLSLVSKHSLSPYFKIEYK